MAVEWEYSGYNFNSRQTELSHLFPWNRTAFFAISMNIPQYKDLVKEVLDKFKTIFKILQDIDLLVIIPQLKGENNQEGLTRVIWIPTTTTWL